MATTITDSEGKVGVSVRFTLSFPYPIICLITDSNLIVFVQKIKSTIFC